MDQLWDNVNSPVETFPVEIAILVVIVFLILLGTRQQIGGHFGLNRYPKLVWMIELIGFPILIVSVVALLRSMFANYLPGTVSADTFDKITATLLWLAGGWLLNRALELFFWEGAFRQLFDNEQAPRLLRGVVAVSIFLLTLYGVATFVFERQTTGLLISTGIIAGVLGLAMQNTLADLFSGLAVTLDRPYSVGHWIELPNGELGQVVDITWKSTRLRSFNHSIYIIPNRLASDSIIHNYNLPNKAYSAWFTVSVDADAPPVLVRRLLLDAVLKSSRVLNEPPPAVRLFDMTGQPYQYLVWVYFEDYMAQFMGKEQLFMNIWLEFSKVGISPAAIKYSVGTRNENIRPDIHMATIVDELRQIDLFAFLSPAEFQSLEAVCHKSVYTAGDIIFEAGAATESMYIVSSGIVSIKQADRHGQLVELERVGPGGYFGEMALFTGQIRSTTVTAVTLCELIEIPQAGLEPVLQAHPDILEQLGQIMATRRAKQTEILDDHGESTSAMIMRSASEIVAKIRHAFGVTVE